MALAALAKNADREMEAAQRRWAGLSKECAAGRQKLVLLRQYNDGYRAQLDAGARQGLPAGQAVAIAAFMRRIAEIVAVEEVRVRQLEETAEREWLRLVEARRHCRMIDVLIDRDAQKKVEAELRRSQREIDDLLGRAGALTRLR